VLNNLTLLPASSPVAAGRQRTVEPYVGLAANQHMSAPISAAQGTAVSAFGKTTRTADRSAFVIDLDVTATPGSPPREAPV
jgi:hypothetical protein